MLPLKRTKQILVILSVIFMVLLAGSVFAYNKVQDKSLEVTALEQELGASFQQGNQEASLRRLINDTAEQRSELNLLFVTQQGTASFIEQVEGLADTARVVLEITNVALNEAPVESLELVELDINARGQWEEVIHFTRLLEAMPKHLQLETLALNRTSAETDDSAPVWAANITLYAYKLSEQNIEVLVEEPETVDAMPTTSTEATTTVSTFSGTTSDMVATSTPSTQPAGEPILEN